jgi:hypothetical protein
MFANPGTPEYETLGVLRTHPGPSFVSDFDLANGVDLPWVTRYLKLECNISGGIHRLLCFSKSAQTYNNGLELVIRMGKRGLSL